MVLSEVKCACTAIIIINLNCSYDEVNALLRARRHLASTSPTKLKKQPLYCPILTEYNISSFRNVQSIKVYIYTPDHLAKF